MKLKLSKKNKKWIKPTIILSVLIFVLGVVLFLVDQNQNINSDAASGCKYITDRRTCITSCSVITSNKPISYACKWSAFQGKCYEGPNQCNTYSEPNCSGEYFREVNGDGIGKRCITLPRGTNLKDHVFECKYPDGQGGQALYQCCSNLLGVAVRYSKTQGYYCGKN